MDRVSYAKVDRRVRADTSTALGYGEMIAEWDGPVFVSTADIAINPDSREKLAMAVASAVVLSPAEFLNRQFLTLFDSEHLSGHFGTGQNGLAELGAFRGGNHQNLAKLNLVACRGVAIVDVQFLALYDAILASPIGDDCIHGTSVLVLRNTCPEQSSATRIGCGKLLRLADVEELVEGQIGLFQRQHARFNPLPAG